MELGHVPVYGTPTGNSLLSTLIIAPVYILASSSIRNELNAMMLLMCVESCDCW